MAFENHSKRWYSPRPFSGRQATILGRPAWMVVEERKKEKQNDRI